MLMQGRGKMQLVLVIVLSDVLFFLLENSNKYSFFTPDNKVMYVCVTVTMLTSRVHTGHS
jgi:A-kinase anchor protein 13